jgi:hypothetical protein
MALYHRQEEKSGYETSVKASSSEESDEEETSESEEESEDLGSPDGHFEKRSKHSSLEVEHSQQALL